MPEQDDAVRLVGMPADLAAFMSLGLIWFVVFLFSTTCHEGAHALVAKWGGDDTAFRGGQVTLSPIPHIQREPIGMVVVPILTYIWMQNWLIGWASVPYDPIWARRYPRRAAWMALAGPAANFTLALIAAAGIRLGLAIGVFTAPQQASFDQMTMATDPGRFGLFATLLSILFMLNIILGTFNLLPVPPLDGNSGITIFMKESTALKFLEMTQVYGMAGIVVAWVVYGRLFGFIFHFALNGLYLGITSYG